MGMDHPYRFPPKHRPHIDPPDREWIDRIERKARNRGVSWQEAAQEHGWQHAYTDIPRQNAAAEIARRQGMTIPGTDKPGQGIVVQQGAAEVTLTVDQLQQMLEYIRQEQAKARGTVAVTEGKVMRNDTHEVSLTRQAKRHIMRKEASQPSAVALAKPASPRIQVFCQSQYDPDE